MGKKLTLFVIIGFWGFQAFAESKEISSNNSFEEIDGNFPANWTINNNLKPGTLQILSESAQDGKNYLMIKNDAKQVFHLYGALIAAAPGDVIRMSVYVKGTGTFRLGVYICNRKNQHIKGIYPEAVKIESSDWQKKDFEITMPCEEFKDKGCVAAIRPVIVVDSNSEINLDNFSGQIEKAATDEINKRG
ncbi:MAG: hypothetical protein WCV67_07750 [Victivallaceae bacterium]|jgi:hypothetical protein